ncbi:MAG: hypothetical protein PUG32_07220, partial [Bacteroidales bacterium]|nr:hypothetical protein [Bacteroidales bacterium]
MPRRKELRQPCCVAARFCVEIGAGVTTLGRTAFQDCQLQKVVFDPANEITTIYEGTFKNCGI